MLSPPGQSPISSSAPWQEDKSAETFRVNGGLDRKVIIGSVTRPFCGTCDRVQLTADGQVRNCLFAATETGLRASLRSGASAGVPLTTFNVKDSEWPAGRRTGSAPPTLDPALADAGCGSYENDGTGGDQVR
jgi:hypothetical protein